MPTYTIKERLTEVRLITRVCREEQHDRAPAAALPVPAEGRVPRGSAQHHLQPRLRQRGHRHPAAEESKPVFHAKEILNFSLVTLFRLIFFISY